MSDTVVLRKIYALDSNTGLPISTNQTTLTDGKGGVYWIPLISSLTSVGGPIIGDLPSTFSTISTNIWGLTSNLSVMVYNLSTQNPGQITFANLASTTTGIISTSYFTNSTLSTVNNLGSLGYVSTAALTSTVSSLGSIGYVSSLSLNSTVAGLGQTYISSTNGLDFNSTLVGLGSAGYISSTQLTSTVAGLGQRYVSIASLLSTSAFTSTAIQSTVRTLGSSGYISTLSLTSSLSSTVRGLGTAGYVSSFDLISTTNALSSLRTRVNIDNAGTVQVNNCDVVFSTVSQAVFLSN